MHTIGVGVYKCTKGKVPINMRNIHISIGYRYQHRCVAVGTQTGSRGQHWASCGHRRVRSGPGQNRCHWVGRGAEAQT